MLNVHGDPSTLAYHTQHRISTSLNGVRNFDSHPTRKWYRFGFAEESSDQTYRVPWPSKVACPPGPGTHSRHHLGRVYQTIILGPTVQSTL